MRAVTSRFCVQQVLEDHGFLRDPHHAALEASESSIKGNILKVGDQGAVCRAVLLGEFLIKGNILKVGD